MPVLLSGWRLSTFEDVSPSAPLSLRMNIISPLSECRDGTGYRRNGDLKLSGNSRGRIVTATNEAKNVLKASFDLKRALIKHGHSSSGQPFVYRRLIDLSRKHLT